MSVVTTHQTGTIDNNTDHSDMPYLPRMIEVAGTVAPHAPEGLAETGVDESVLTDLTLRLANTVPHFTTEWASEQLCLPMQLIDEMCWRLKDDKFVEILGENGAFSYRYAITSRGREFAAHLNEFCGYVGPAPVSLSSYRAMLEWQVANRRPITSEDVRSAISELVLPETAAQVTELVVSAGRSLFLFGPAGNGKTSVARLLHRAIEGELWIPHCIDIAGSVIRIFDPQCHERVEQSTTNSGKIDRRWIKIKRPFIVSGGEMTIEALDLAYSPSLRFYEAPLHVKANGGTFLIDDFGRQRVNPEDLLNRWIIPLEHQIDHLTLHTGQKIDVPFRLMLIVATNLTVSDVADPAFLRRMGYRVHLDKPNPESYARIFERYAAQFDTEVDPELLSYLLERYITEQRDLRCCEPRDLIERIRDICHLRGEDFRIDQDVLDLAWIGYFGNM